MEVSYNEVVGFFEDVEIDSIVSDGHGLCFPTYAGVHSGEPVHACCNVVVYVVHDKSFDGRLYALEVNSEGSCFAFNVRKHPDKYCVTEMLWENSTVFHNPNASLMTLLAALDNELWLLKV
ncbi:hypothetical protein DSO57_1003003 [Entomophthora muscae]|uniref:Uncharacterized protein n=1 Tax=Entomophthora muscae TaxID=34485 RepID=A0ACC2SXG3_9FUNG|nr:hypothetical protein DSO57_1003003 [Entomophthora muscae]